MRGITERSKQRKDKSGESKGERARQNDSP